MFWVYMTEVGEFVEDCPLIKYDIAPSYRNTHKKNSCEKKASPWNNGERETCRPNDDRTYENKMITIERET
jgi:hypothetical protein